MKRKLDIKSLGPLSLLMCEADQVVCYARSKYWSNANLLLVLDALTKKRVQEARASMIDGVRVSMEGVQYHAAVHVLRHIGTASGQKRKRE